MREAYYFPHDNNARNDQKILILRGKFGLDGYALFWMCIETMAEEKEGYIHREAIGGLSLGYGVAITKLEEFIEYCININLFKEKDKKIYSDRLLEHKKIRQELSKFGKKGAEKRWGKNSPPNSNKGKERKGKENKPNDSVANFISDDDKKLAQLLKDLITTNTPTFKEPNLESWSDEINKIHRLDNRTYEQIEYVIKWAQQNSFWQANILSPAKLRKQFDTLVAQIKRDSKPNLVIAQ